MIERERGELDFGNDDVITFARLGEYGQLGNQLFQVAATLGIARENARQAVFPEWDYGSWFNVSTRPRSWFESRSWKVLRAAGFSYDEALMKIPPGPNVSLEGYLQSERYFADCKDTVRDALLTERIRRLGDRVARSYAIPPDNNFCAVHIRRGDYLKFSDTYVRLESTDYYAQAMEVMKREYRVTTFVVISDDQTWCREMLKGDSTFFSRNVRGIKYRIMTSAKHAGLARKASSRWSAALQRYRSERDLRDLMLMARCRHQIIANSSFSWWGSWLSYPRQGTVIAPIRWFTNGTLSDTRDLYRPEMRLL